MTEPLKTATTEGDDERAADAAAAASPDDELVPEDDRVIGQALRWSAIALVALAVVAALVFW